MVDGRPRNAKFSDIRLFFGYAAGPDKLEIIFVPHPSTLEMSVFCGIRWGGVRVRVRVDKVACGLSLCLRRQMRSALDYPPAGMKGPSADA